MTMEEILAVVQKIKDAWVAFGQSMAEAAQALEDTRTWTSSSR